MKSVTFTVSQIYMKFLDIRYFVALAYIDSNATHFFVKLYYIFGKEASALAK
jgi:hypothetical protein